jgi:uncharacterized protein YdaU (DUF1376 family)
MRFLLSLGAAMAEINTDRVRQFMPLLIKKLLDDPHVAMMSAEEQMMYVYMLLQMWRASDPVGVLPNDDRKIAALLKVSVKRWLECADAIRPCFKLGEDGMLHQDGMKRLWAQQVDRYADTCRKSAIAVAAKKAKRNRKNNQQVNQQVNSVDNRSNNATLNATLTTAQQNKEVPLKEVLGQSPSAPRGATGDAQKTTPVVPAKVPVRVDHLGNEIVGRFS